MQAFQLVEAKKPAQLREVPVPEPGSGQVLVKVGGAGACHSDLHIMEAPLGSRSKLPFTPRAQTGLAKYSRQSDVSYGRKFGLALTMEVFAPAKPNGLRVIWVVSSSGKSSREQTLQSSFARRISPLLEHGWLPTIWKRASLHASALIARWSGILAGDARRFRSQLATGVFSVFERTSNCCQ